MSNSIIVVKEPQTCWQTKKAVFSLTCCKRRPTQAIPPYTRGGGEPHAGPYHSTHNKNVTQVCVCPANLYTLLVCEVVRVCVHIDRVALLTPFRTDLQKVVKKSWLTGWGGGHTKMSRRKGEATINHNLPFWHVQPVNSARWFCLRYCATQQT